MRLRLYDYFRSSAAYRVRIALHLKGLDYESVAVDLGRGAQREAAFVALNPQARVPVLEADGAVIAQSLAIIAYLDEAVPKPPLLPDDPLLRARVRAVAQTIACDIHPLNNLKVLNYLRSELGQDEEKVERWYRHWVETGLAALEKELGRARLAGPYCFGQRVTLADVCLVPQLYNARRFACDLSGCPTLVAIDEVCRKLPAFAAAAPERRPDAV